MRGIAAAIALRAVPLALALAVESTVSRAMGKLFSAPMAQMIVNLAGEVAPPGISANNWKYVVQGIVDLGLHSQVAQRRRSELQEWSRFLGGRPNGTWHRIVDVLDVTSFTASS